MSQPQDTSPTQLGSKSIPKLLLDYSVPAIIASLATSLYNIIDSIFIGRGVGAMAIAGLAITFPLMNLVAAFCMLIAAGGATISSIFLGQRNSERATDTVNNVFSLCLIHAAVFGGLTLMFLDEILVFFGATPETLPYAREFMQIILYGTPASFVLIGLNNVMRATGYPAKAMITALISVVVNIALCPILIFSLGMGIKGAALATICGQSVGAIWVLRHFLSHRTTIRFSRHGKWLSRSIVRHIYAIGLSPFLMNVCACIVVVFINKALLDYGGEAGNIAIGAYGIINRASMFFVMIVFGVTQGMQPILGFNYGAGQWNRVRHTLFMGVWIGVAINTAGWITAEFFPSLVSKLFTVDEALIAIADRGLRIFFIFYPLVGCQIVIQNFFQSIGKPKISIFLSLTRQLIFLLPLLFILPRHWGIDGVWASMSASDFIAFVIAIVTAWIILHRENLRFSTMAENKNRPTNVN